MYTRNTDLFGFHNNTDSMWIYLLRAQQFALLTDLPLVVCDYEHNDFLNQIKGFEHEVEGGLRCQKCIELRLKQSFEYAQNNNYDYVTTTLSISPHKNALFINSCGEQFEKIYNTNYLYADFKKDNGFLLSISESKRLELYRQDYCGCEFSMHANIDK